MFPNLGSMRETLLQVHHIGSHSTPPRPLGGAIHAEHAVLHVVVFYDPLVSRRCSFI
jgi:hypothetical protein